ncbi:UdgX family uracil-DNA binding protein [Actinoalloteichus spitiensis]|uniref:UdgX family uracil-DNA binding protein n=1 Tax=Actinoalloteichus spitiensis TaxID=252394 RepID=UPI000474B680|nr:UdgX family uracil-DNA binding protein [Actinoalloteichus spitiensis]
MPGEQPDATPFVPARAGLPGLRRAAAACRGCDLHRDATQVVFGRGPAAAEVVLVGEQPGDREDVEGVPFVGPAGRVLDRGLREAGIDRDRAYLTNAVKHFRFTRGGTGKPRLHRQPNRTHRVACRPWLVAELAVVRPRLVVALGAVAAKTLLGESFRVTRHRGEPQRFPAEELGLRRNAPDHLVATVHPSAVLRARDREDAYAGFLADLTTVADLLRPA